MTTALKRVISYSLYGNKPIYVEGAVANARDAKAMFPGWVARFYLDTGHPVIPRLVEHGAEIVEETPSPDARGMFWRFQPMLDPSVERFFTRDVDARLLQRDVVTVRDWLKSDKPFVLWRDHPAHFSFPVMGGMWGGVYSPSRAATFGDRMKAWIAKTIETHGAIRFNCDQGFLRSCLDIIAGHNCQDLLAFCYSPRKGAFETPFPADAIPRGGNDVGYIGARIQPSLHVTTADPDRPYTGVVVITGMSAEREEMADRLLESDGFKGMTKHKVQATRGVDIHTPAWFKAEGSQRHGAFGCFMSHVNALLWGIKNCDSFFVFEDDVVLRPGWERIVGRALADAPPGWTVISMGSSNDHNRRISKLSDNIGVLRGGGGAYAHLWSNRGARVAVECLLQNPTHYDVALHKVYQDYTGYTTLPLVAGQRGGVRSDIFCGCVYDHDCYWDPDVGNNNDTN